MPGPPPAPNSPRARVLECADTARLWLSGLGVREPQRAYRDLCDLAARGIAPESIAGLLHQLDRLLPLCPDPDMVLTNLDRFVAAASDPAECVASLNRTPRATEALLQLFGTSQYFAELIIRDPEIVAWLRTGVMHYDRETLFEQLGAALALDRDETAHRLTIRRFRQRQMLRIGYNDIVRGLPLEVITQDLSNLADVCIEAAVRLARAKLVERHGEALGPDDQPARFVVLAFGKLGGAELNYSSDIDLMFVYEDEGLTRGTRSVTHADFFARLGGEVVRLLSDHTAMGQAYRVDMRLRPEGDQGPLARSLAATIGYYETKGRTWERQALIKCRPCAGDLSLGREFLAAITPFVYRRYLTTAEIGEIKAMKRRIESRTHSAGEDDLEVKTGRGGIRDVEFVVQFLQLLHGGCEPAVRHSTTLVAIDRLEHAGCLSPEERHAMEDTYRFLRRIEHRLQTMFDRQTHRMPEDPEEQRTLALRLGYAAASAWEDRTGPTDRFRYDYRSKTEKNRRILNHLLHDAFPEEREGPADPVIDLILDPDPPAELIAGALGRYPFRDPTVAHRNLLALAREDHEFLSQHRCRHFFAAIAPALLRAVARTADPDLTLTNLEKVSASLGAKAILWELFSLNPPSLRLYVELCSTSQLLSEILVNNPGMIDDLIDSLVVDRPQPGSSIRSELAELCRGAEDLRPILQSFRNKEWLRIGTRDVLGREPIRDVTRELADVAEAVVGQVARDQWERRLEVAGTPRRQSDGRRARLAILALGKLGGREMTYHSDLDLIFLYDEEGQTDRVEPSISNSQFFTELAQRILRYLERSEGAGPLYRVDTRLRPYGSAGPLALSLEAFQTYYRTAAQPWERLALTRARVLYSQGTFGRDVTAAIVSILGQPVDPATLAGKVAAMRQKRMASRGTADLKRGPGGLVDLEFLVQYLILVHAPQDPEVLRPNLWDAVETLKHRGFLSAEVAHAVRSAYDFWRAIEARLRLVHNRTDVALPDDPEAIGRLIRQFPSEAGSDPVAAALALRADAARHGGRIGELFERLVVQTAGSPAAVTPTTPSTEGSSS